MGYFHFVLTVIFAFNLGIPPSIEVYLAFFPFGFLMVFLSINEISLAFSIECDPSYDFYERKIFRLKKTTRDIFIL
jgi:hypothetical protein